METFLITGGAGFIGSNFIEYLYSLENNRRVINVDKLTYAGNMENLSSFAGSKNHIFIREDICCKQNIDNILCKYRPDFVINFAAETHVDKSIAASDNFVNTNVLGTHNLLQSALKHGVKRYLQISTDEVYGPALHGDCFNEDRKLDPSNPYSASKSSADMLALSFFRTHNLPVVISRSTNTYGPKQHEEKLIPMTIKCCLSGRRIPIYGTGRNSRTWIHVNDLCSALLSVLMNGRAGSVYNISTTNEIDNLQLVKLIIKNLNELTEFKNSSDELSENSLIYFVEDRKGHDMRYCINSSKLQNELGWTPKQDFNSGIASAVKWYVDNKHRFSWKW